MATNQNEPGLALHQPVMQAEALSHWCQSDTGIYIDGTFGRGGHSAALLGELSDLSHLYAFDQDATAAAWARAHFDDPRFHFLHNNFSKMYDCMAEQDLVGKVDGILLDLGVSSPQLDDAERGFSFIHDGPLDMRMDTRQSLTAAAWVAETDEEDMKQVFKSYGEERFSGRIARAIVEARAETSIITTKQLAEIVKAAHPRWEKNKHPATRVFQAIRIAINRELDVLEKVLGQTIDLLKPGGRLVVISFHSLEDRIVKQFMRKSWLGDPRPPEWMGDWEAPKLMRPVKPIIKPSSDEIRQNPRARSAIMRVAIKQ